MDFEALRARADDVVTGIAADITESILTVVDDVLTMVEDAKAEAESYQSTGININGDMSPEKVRKAVEDILNRTGVRSGAGSKSDGAVAGNLNEEELVRYTYRYLTKNHGAYIDWDQKMEDYIATSQWASDKATLFEDMDDLINGRAKRKGEDKA